MNRRMLAIAAVLLVGPWSALLASNASAPQADLEGVKAASQAFYEALAVIDDGAAMARVWAHAPYVTMAGPRSKSILVGWDAHRKYWKDVNERFSERNVSLSEQHIHVNGDLAWEMGQEIGTAKFKDGTILEVDFIVTNVYEKMGDRWVMVSHHVQPKPQ